MRILTRLTFVLILLHGAVVSAEFEGYDAEPDAAVAVPGDSCWVPVVKRCCAEAGAQLAVNCDMQGVKWTCHAPVAQNPLIMTTKPAATGWSYSFETGNSAVCKYTQVTCGPAVLECTRAIVQTSLQCKEKDAGGDLCETPITANPN